MIQKRDAWRGEWSRGEDVIRARRENRLPPYVPPPRGEDAPLVDARPEDDTPEFKAARKAAVARARKAGAVKLGFCACGSGMTLGPYREHCTMCTTCTACGVRRTIGLACECERGAK